MNNADERRRYKRYKVQDGVIAFIGNPSNMMGSIIDVSKGGLAFRYIKNGKQPGESCELDILYTNELIYIDKMPFKAVSDMELKDNSSGLFPTRRCGVQFGELTHEQELELERLLRCHTGEC